MFKNISRNDILKTLGSPYKKVPINPIIKDEIDKGNYIQQQIEYNTDKNEKGFAFLLIPKSIKFDSIIICHHQHAGNYKLGKSEVVGIEGDINQFYAKELTELGFVTFSPDAIAFEDRNESNYTWHHNYYELSVRIVKGKTLLLKVLHDISIGIDYLLSRKEFKEFKIGFIGHSYGGRMAIWMPFYDQRILASVSNCGCIQYKHSCNKNTGIQMEVCIPNVLNEYDIENVVSLIEPNHLLLSVTKNDKWSKGYKEIYNYAKSFFKTGDLKLLEYEGEHIFTQEMRKNAYAFLIEKLK